MCVCVCAREARGVGGGGGSHGIAGKRATLFVYVHNYEAEFARGAPNEHHKRDRDPWVCAPNPHAAQNTYSLCVRCSSVAHIIVLDIGEKDILCHLGQGLPHAAHVPVCGLALDQSSVRHLVRLNSVLLYVGEHV